jgi:hypothetical protein
MNRSAQLRLMTLEKRRRAQGDLSYLRNLGNSELDTLIAELSPTFPTGPLILRFWRKNASRINGRSGENACSEDLPSFRILVCA